MYSRSFLCWCLIAVSIPFSTKAANHLDSIIKRIEQQKEFSPAIFSLCVLDKHATVLYQFNKDKNLLPASSLKALTTATALQILGPSFRYATQLAYTGKIIDHELHGDIYIIGSGDPSLGSKYLSSSSPSDSFLQLWVQAIAALGIKKIRGTIQIDDRIFDDNYPSQTWLWEDIGSYYGAPASGLNCFDNEFELTFNGNTKHGDQSEITSFRRLPAETKFINQVKIDTTLKRDNAYIFKGPAPNEYLLRGSISPGRNALTIKGSLQQPSTILIEALKQALSEYPISLADSAYTAKIPLTPIVFHTHYSPPLAEIIGLTNRYSLNLYAEALIKTIGKSQHECGNTRDGLEVMRNLWKKKGVSLETAYLTDGSGLSRMNAVSAYQLALALAMMMREEDWPIFKKSLPIAGVSGTLSSLCERQPCGGKIIAKSGTMEGALSYTGYIQTKNADFLPFCIMVNHFQGRSKSIRKSLELIFNELVNL